MKRRTSNAVKALLISLALIPAWAQATPEMYFIHTDHLGTPQVMTDDTGSEVWRASYRPFGELASVEGTADLALRFSGQYEDPETGYYYNYFRDYDPSLGRYVQSDPIGLEGGINTYAYVKGNPISFIDPFGLKEYPDNFTGPLPPNGYYTSEMTQTKCGKVPPAPPGVFVNINMWVADNSWNPLWFFNQVRGKSPWDYKQQGRRYEDFGNFNFGAVGIAYGLPLNILQRGAGWANQRADPTRTNLGNPWGGYPYGDDPDDQEQVKKGASYCECMGY